MEPEICTKMPRNLSEKLEAKFPASALGYSMEKIARREDAFLEIFQLKVNRRCKKIRNEEQGKAKN